MLSLHVPRAPYMVPSRSWVDWSLPDHYLFATWSVHGPYLVFMRSRLCLYGHNMVPTWSLYDLPRPSMVLTRSIPDQYLFHTWFICGLYVVPSCSCMVLTWFLCVPYMLWHGLCGPYLVPTWSWSPPGSYVVLTWFCWSKDGPYVLSMGPKWGTYVCGLTWSLHGLHGPLGVPTQFWPAWPLPGLTWSLPGPCLVPTWSPPGFKKFFDNKRGSAKAVMYDSKGFCQQLGKKWFPWKIALNLLVCYHNMPSSNF
jgi:hypothetical protein